MFVRPTPRPEFPIDLDSLLDSEPIEPEDEALAPTERNPKVSEVLAENMMRMSEIRRPR